MSWDERLRPTIKLISPNFIPFAAKWVGNERSKEKSLGRFKFPGIGGEYIQDLDFGATAYPMTIYFDGANHDLVSESFWNACDQKGRWTVIHPTKFKLTLQLASVKEKILPVESGNITGFELQFFESLELYEIISGKHLSAIASAANIAFTVIAVAEFAGAVITESVAAVQQLKTLGTSLGNDLAASTKDITTGLPDLRDAILKKQKQLGNYIAGFNLNGIAQSISDLNQAGIQAYDQLATLNQQAFPLDTMLKFIDAQIDGPISNLPFVDNMRLGGDPGIFNQAIICEITIGTGLSAQADLLGRYPYKNRSDAILAIEKLQSNFERSMNAIETVQGYFNGQLLKNQYIGYLRTYGAMREVFSNAVRAILESIVNLPTIKTYTTEKPSSPIVEFAKFYTKGDIDSLYDQFIADNQFTGDKILYLSTGTDVVIYAR